MCNCPKINIQIRLQKQIASVVMTTIRSFETLHWWILYTLSKHVLNIMGYFLKLFYVFFYVEYLCLQLFDLGTSKSLPHSIDLAQTQIPINKYCEHTLNNYVLRYCIFCIFRF